MTTIGYEVRLVLRSRLSVAVLGLVLAIASGAIAAGLSEVRRERGTIERLNGLQQQESARRASESTGDGDAENAAYETFVSTWSPPSTLAFAALGQRDVAPYILRVRALGLQAQLYDGEIFNPELALPGRFDFAFVLVYLAPLFLIAVLHDLLSSEREAGRLTLLLTLDKRPGLLWQRRTIVRAAMIYAALAFPFIAGAMVSGAALAGIVWVLTIVSLYLAFWTGISVLVVVRANGSAASAATLLSIWLVLTVVSPALAHIAINRAVPVAQGIELMLAQRQNVHAAWEIPRNVTMEKFFVNHPEWRATKPVVTADEAKWYFAFHQVGDESVAPQVAEYRASLVKRQAMSSRIGYVLPAVGVQLLIHRLAGTDLAAQLGFEDRITAFHATLREFFYPYLFNERAFTLRDFDRVPAFRPGDPEGTIARDLLAVLAAIASLMVVAGTVVSCKVVRIGSTSVGAT